MPGAIAAPGILSFDGGGEVTYRIRIDEIKDDRLIKINDENFEQGILKCGEVIGMFGFSNPMEIILQMEEFAENLAIRVSGLDEKDDPGENDILAAVITECIIGINLATLALGPIAETGIISDEAKRIKLRKHTFELIEKGKEIASICDTVRVSTMDEYKRKLGELIMDELEESEKRDQKEEG